jgi:hypothetical protein
MLKDPTYTDCSPTKQTLAQMNSRFLWAGCSRRYEVVRRLPNKADVRCHLRTVNYGDR